MKRIFLVILLLSAFLSIAPSNLNLSLTNNLFNSSAYTNDVVAEMNFSYALNNSSMDFFANCGAYFPVINNYMFNIPFDMTIQYAAADTYTRAVLTGAYWYQTLYVTPEYKENNLVVPGVYIDEKEYIGNYFILKNSADVFYEAYPFLTDYSSAKAEYRGKIIVGLPIDVSMHLGVFAGYKYSMNGPKILNVRISPLVSANIFGSIGLALSYDYQKVYGDTLDYYLDDSFLDDYSFDASIVGGKITYSINGDSKFVIGAEYGKYAYLPLYHSSVTADYIVGEVEAREDELTKISALLKIKTGKVSPYFKYLYQKRESTNSEYTFNSSALSLGIEF